MLPKLSILGLHFPSNSRLDVGPTVGNGYQIRVGGSFSPLDFYRAIHLLRAGDAECVARTASDHIDKILTHAKDIARLQALRTQEDYLLAHQERWRAIAAESSARLAAGVITLDADSEIQQHAAELERRLIQLRGEADQLAIHIGDLDLEALGPLLAAYEEGTTSGEHELRRARVLDAWELRVSGGVIPERQSADWYGVAEVSFNLGGLWRGGAERRFVGARIDELRDADYERLGRVRLLAREVHSAREQALRELAIVERHVSTLVETRRALRASEANSNIAIIRSRLELEQIAAQAESEFLKLQASLLSRIEENCRV
jgi:hypothetical protein